MSDVLTGRFGTAEQYRRYGEVIDAKDRTLKGKVMAKPVKENFIPAMFWLGCRYMNENADQFGFPQVNCLDYDDISYMFEKNPNYIKGVKLLKRAVDKGYILAYPELAFAYSNGSGVKKNPKTALSLLNDAISCYRSAEIDEKYKNEFGARLYTEMGDIYHREYDDSGRAQLCYENALSVDADYLPAVWGLDNLKR